MGKDTIVRLIVAALALVNTVLTLIGWNPIPISDDMLYTAVSAIIAIVTTTWVWWKNNSITRAAVTADTIMAALKEGTITAAQVKAFIVEMEQQPKGTTGGAQ